MTASMLLRFGASRTSATTLYCFHGAAAGASSFRSWSTVAGGRLDVVGVQMPGREGRLLEPPAVSIETAVEGVVRSLAADLDGSFALFGHSMGAYHAFECARRLHALGARPPAVLVLAGARAPLWDAGADPDDTDESLRDHLRRLGGTPDEVMEDPELMGLMLPTLRADLRAVRSYAPLSDGLDVRVAVLAGTDDPLAPPADMLSWRPWFRSGPVVVELPGDHFFVHRSSAIEEIVRLCSNAPLDLPAAHLRRDQR